MSKNVSIHSQPFFFGFIICIALCLPWTAQADILTPVVPCFDWTEIQAEDRMQISGGFHASTQCFDLSIPQAGEVAVDVNSGERDAFVWVDATSQATHGLESSRIDVERHGLSSLRLLADGAASVRLRLWVQEGRRPFEPVTVITDFLPGHFATRDLEDDEREDSGEIEIEPWYAPTIIKGGGKSAQVVAVAPPCRSAKLDDHGDTRRCATPFAGFPAVAHGEISSAPLDDGDVFEMRVDATRKVTIFLESKVDLGLLLEDDLGRRLTVDAEAWGHSKRFTMVLLPGHYFVRIVGGAWTDEAAYELRVETPDVLR